MVCSWSVVGQDLLLFGVRSTPMLLQWHVKDPSHSAKSAGGRLHLNTHTPLTQLNWNGPTMPLSRHCVGTLPGNELIWDSSGNTQSQSCQLAEPLWTNSGVKSGISVLKLISALKKKIQVGTDLSNILPKSLQVRKKPAPKQRKNKNTLQPVCGNNLQSVLKSFTSPNFWKKTDLLMTFSELCLLILSIK